LELGAGFHPELTGRENVFLNASILGIPRKEIARKFDDIVEFSGLGQFISSPVKTYSSGMYVRLAFAVAINVDPHLLIVDEILAVGDVTFQQRCLEKFVEFRNDGRTIVLVTHDLGSVRNLCDRAIWLRSGAITDEGDPAELVDAYTESMLGGRLIGKEGSLRRGSGEIEIESVELLVGPERAPAKRFRTGNDVVLRLRYRCEKSVPRPVFGFVIDQLGGVTVTSPSTRDAGLLPETVSGDGYIEVVLPACPLLPGTYDLHTVVTDFNRQHVYDHVQMALRFDVMTGSPYETEGVVTLHPTWVID